MTLVVGSAIAAVVLACALAVNTYYRGRERLQAALQIGLGLALAILITSGALALVGWPPRDYLDDDTQRTWNRNLRVVSDLCSREEQWTAVQKADFRRAVDALVGVVEDHGDEWSSSGVTEKLDERTEDQLDDWAATYRANRCDGPPGTGRYLIEARRQ